MGRKKNSLSVSRESIVFCAYLKIALGVSAYRAYFGSLCSNNDMTAVTAFPYLDIAILEYCRCFNVFEQSAVAFLVMLFDRAYHGEFRSQFGESLLLGSFGEALVHICPLVVLAVRCCREICCGIAYTVKFFEPHFCVFLLVFSGLEKQDCYLLKPLLFSLQNNVFSFNVVFSKKSKFFS